ncbi:hypothetical protein Q604_UNBC09287G0001, partial [human gut metagenome]
VLFRSITVTRWLSDGSLPVLRIGTRPRVPAADDIDNAPLGYGTRTLTKKQAAQYNYIY